MTNQTEPQFTKPKHFSVKAIKRGVFIFVGISILTFTLLFLYTNTGKTLDVWSRVDWRYLAGSIVFILVDLYIGGLRNHIFVREFVPGISQMVCIKANLANIFMGAVTPSQSGGGPAQWYILYRNGVSLMDVIGTSFYNWISTILFFPLSGAFAIYILQDDAPGGLIMHLTQFGFGAFSTLLIIVLLGLFAPRVLHHFIQGLVKFVGKFYSPWTDKIESIGNNLTAKFEEYRSRYLGLMTRQPQLMVYSFILTIVLYLNKYILGYILILAFGIQADFWHVIAIQAVVYLLLYFAPSPGGSGIAELSISGLMSSVIATEYLASFTLLYRSVLVFIPALIGSYVVLRQISKE